MMTHKNPTKVLVIGGGDGGVVRQVLKHPSLTKVVLVEIDEIIINEFRKSKTSEDPRLEIVVGDAK
jgi:spermidine synthase